MSRSPTRTVPCNCKALGLPHSSFYYPPCGESAYNLELMRLLDEEFTDHNFKGILGLYDHLRLAGHFVIITYIPMAKGFLYLAAVLD